MTTWNIMTRKTIMLRRSTTSPSRSSTTSVVTLLRSLTGIAAGFDSDVRCQCRGGVIKHLLINSVLDTSPYYSAVPYAMVSRFL